MLKQAKWLLYSNVTRRYRFKRNNSPFKSHRLRTKLRTSITSSFKLVDFRDTISKQNFFLQHFVLVLKDKKDFCCICTHTNIDFERIHFSGNEQVNFGEENLQCHQMSWRIRKNTFLYIRCYQGLYNCVK